MDQNNLTSPVDTQAGLRAFQAVVTRMIGARPAAGMILYDVVCEGRAVPVVLLRPSGVVLLDRLESEQPLQGSAYGPWYAGETPLSPTEANPYQRAQALRAAWLDFLDRYKRRFLAPEKADAVRLERVAVWSVVVPRRHPATMLDLDSRARWFRLIDLATLPAALARFDSQPPLLEPAELERLAALLAPGPAAPACFVCQLNEEPCQFWRLEGSVLDVKQVAVGNGRTLTSAVLQTDDGWRVGLILNPPWDRLAMPLRRLLEERTTQTTSAAPPPRLAAFHLEEVHHNGNLEFRTNRSSLVVLEPALLLNVNELAAFSACPMRYLIARFVSEGPSAATVRGNLVHQAFQQALQEDDEVGAIQHALAACLADIAAADLRADMLIEEMAPHVRKIRQLLAVHRPAIGEPVSEPVVISPSLGITGRIDGLWEQEDGSVTGVVELKTGRSRGGTGAWDEAKQQIRTYGAVLLEQGRLLDPASLRIFYTGDETPLATAVALNYGDLRWAVRQRNGAAMVELLGKLDTAMIGCPHACPPFAATHCSQLRFLLGIGMDAARTTLTVAPNVQLTETDRAFFQAMYEALLKERRQTHHLASAQRRKTVAERLADGTTIRLDPGPWPPPERTAEGRWRYQFTAENQSELRAGDWVTIGDGSTAGQLIPGTIEAIMPDHQPGRSRLTVIASEKLHRPRVLDRNDGADALDRAFEALYRWMQTEDRLRELVDGRRAPRFGTPVSAAALQAATEGLNLSQAAAIEKALRAEDYALIWGPPGAGKTRVIARLASALASHGERVLLAAFTNQALDNLGLRLLAEGETRFLFLSDRGRTDDRLDAHRLYDVAARQAPPNASLDERVAAIRRVVTQTPIAISTAHQIAGGKLDRLLARGEDLPPFDTVILDEASQLTLPLALGAIRLGRRFVLVGDHRQLQPVVQTRELAESLFERLWTRWEHAQPAASTDPRVALTVQYRMHPAIAAFPNRAWYDGRLESGVAIPTNRSPASLPILRLPALHPEALRQLQRLLDPSLPYVFADLDHRQASRRAGPRRNEREARLAAMLAQAALALGYPADEIGIIAPYRSQVALIRDQLAAWDSTQAILVDTVDRFQGSERDLIIVSLAIYEPALGELLEDERRLNVALTRARRKLIVIGDRAVLRRHPTYAALIEAGPVISFGRAS